MSRRATIWALGVLGWVISYGFFTHWLVHNDWAFVHAWVEAFTASVFATGLLTDLVATSLMLVALAVYDRERLGPRWTAAVVGCLALSVSMSLAVYVVGIARRAHAQPAGP